MLAQKSLKAGGAEWRPAPPPQVATPRRHQPSLPTVPSDVAGLCSGSSAGHGSCSSPAERDRSGGVQRHEAMGCTRVIRRVPSRCPVDVIRNQDQEDSGSGLSGLKEATI